MRVHDDAKCHRGEACDRIPRLSLRDSSTTLMLKACQSERREALP